MTKKEQILELSAQGFSTSEIAKKIKTDLRYVRRIKNNENEIIYLRAENARLRRELEKHKKSEALFSRLEEVIHSIIPNRYYCEYETQKKKNAIKETAVLVLSDMHADQNIKSERVQNFENYNFEEVCKRAQRIVDVTISHLKDNLKGYSFEKLIVCALGDLVSGEIHNLIQFSEWQNAIKNAMATGELLSMMLCDLAKYFPIEFYGVVGNHGRRFKKKQYQSPHNNWDYLVMTYMKRCLESLKSRVKIYLPESYSCAFNIYKWNFIINHGDDIKSWNSIPYYGIERKTRRLIAVNTIRQQAIHYFIFAHFHSSASIQSTTGEVFVNGKWMATDEYALEKLGEVSEPYQLLFGVHPKYGATWRLPIKLKENIKNIRYKISF